MERTDAPAVYVADALLDALCEIAADREPSPVSVPLSTTPAGNLGVELAEEQPVFTHFYLPDSSRSVSAVFGVDLGTPAGSAPGLFLTHPDGRRGVSRRDDFREVMLVAVPPWRPADVRAYDRRGRRRPVVTLEVTLPDEHLF